MQREELGITFAQTKGEGAHEQGDVCRHPKRSCVSFPAKMRKPADNVNSCATGCAGEAKIDRSLLSGSRGNSEVVRIGTLIRSLQYIVLIYSYRQTGRRERDGKERHQAGESDGLLLSERRNLTSPSSPILLASGGVIFDARAKETQVLQCRKPFKLPVQARSRSGEKGRSLNHFRAV